MSRKAVAIFGSSATEPGSIEWTDAETTGRQCVESGLAVVTGGYGGTMEAACKGARQAGGEAIGVTVPGLFTSRAGPNPYVTREIEAKSLTDRIGILTDLACGVVVLPGSIGTAAELIISWNLNHVGRNNGGRRLPTVAVGAGWARFWDLATGMLGAAGADVHVTGSATAAVDWLLAQPETLGGDS